jgi:hypothetical protein
MIRPIDIRLNAAHPELPLVEAVTFTGSPSTVLIRGVPPNCGRWAITAVFVAASFPDGSTTTRAAVQSANGVWVATLPATATSGRTANGIRVLADGIDENGEAVTGYILGVADFAVASLDVTPAPEPGETSYQLLYFDEVPSVLHKGDVTKIDGVLKFYNGTAWEPFAAPVTFDNAVTRTSANGVKSSGIWSAIWGALSALPTGFMSLYDWCVAQLAGKASTADATLTNKYTDWVVVGNLPSGSTWISSDVWYDPSDDYWKTWLHFNGGEDHVLMKADGAPYTALELSFEGEYDGDELSMTTRRSFSGYQLGSQADKPLAPEAEAEELRTEVAGKLDKSSEAWTVSYTDDGLHIADTAGVYYIDISPGGIKTTYPNAHNVYWPLNGGTIALLENLTGNFSSSTAYAKDALVVYMGALYRCVNPNGHTGTWVAADFTTATVEDILAALRTTMAGKADASDLLAKLDSTSAAPAFSSDSSVSYAVGAHVTYNGKLYKCTTATTGGTWVAASWTADTMTDPDAVLDITAQNQLRVVAKDGTVLWAQGYDLASTSSATLACDATNNFTFADGATSQAFTLPTAPTGKVGDLGLDIDNSANTSAATMTLTGLDTAFSVVVPEGESLNDMLAIAAGELARFYITLSTFRINNLPTWHIVKQVVENGGAQS